MNLTKKIKLIASSEQSQEIWEVSKILNNLYNAGLRNRITRYSKGKPTSLNEQKRLIPRLKSIYKKYQIPFGRLLHETLIQLDRSYSGFFKRCKTTEEGKKGFPRFRSSSKFFTHYIERQHVYVEDGFFLYKFGRKVGKQPLRLKLTEPLPDEYGMVMFCHNVDGFYLSVTHKKSQEEFEDDGSVLAIDLGIKRLGTAISDKNKAYFSGSQNKKVRKISKGIDKVISRRSKCKKFSRRYKFLTKVIQRLFLKRSRVVQDFLHKESHKFCKRFVERTIVVGDLSVSQMSKKKAKRKGLNRSLYEWNLASFYHMLDYKSKLYGKRLVKINEAYTSKTCSSCGKQQDMPLYKRQYNCSCGYSEDRDLNSARNILRRFFAQFELPTQVGNLSCVTN